MSVSETLMQYALRDVEKAHVDPDSPDEWLDRLAVDIGERNRLTADERTRVRAALYARQDELVCEREEDEHYAWLRSHGGNTAP